MTDRAHLDDDRKRSEAFEALAHPERVPARGVEAAAELKVVEIHDGEVFDDEPGEEDILEGLDRQGLDPRTEKRSE